jgi:hypothetical protein
MLPADVAGYLSRLTERIGGVLGASLLGAYLVGGAALGDFRPEASDLDVLAIVDAPLERAVAVALAGACSAARLPCPARKLELVVVTAGVAAAPGATVDWELNLNTGEREDDHVGLDPAGEPRHWFVLDLALARQCGIALTGPDVGTLVGPMDRAVVRSAQADCVAWFLAEGDEAAAAAAACRAWHWRETGRFASKREALRWAADRASDRAAERGSSIGGA